MRTPVGRLRDRLILQVPVEVGGDGGSLATTWSTAGLLWGAVEAVQARDGERADAARTASLWRIVIRHRADVTVGQRLIARGRTLAVRAVEDPDGTRRRLICRCEEVEP